jgi:hypothetical protein
LTAGTVEVIGVSGPDRDALADALARPGRAVCARTLDAAGHHEEGFVHPMTVALLPSGDELVRPFVEALLETALRPAPPTGAGHRRLVVVRRHDLDTVALAGDWMDTMVRQLLRSGADAAEEVGISTHFVRHRGPARPGTASPNEWWAPDVAAAVDFVHRLAPRVALPELALDRAV